MQLNHQKVPSHTPIFTGGSGSPLMHSLSSYASSDHRADPINSMEAASAGIAKEDHDQAPCLGLCKSTTLMLRASRRKRRNGRNAGEAGCSASGARHHRILRSSSRRERSCRFLYIWSP